MSYLPFLVKYAKLSGAGVNADSLTQEDDLPSVVNRDFSGIFFAGQTRFTEVNQETTDDD
jgi:hypothetical protein